MSHFERVTSVDFQDQRKTTTLRVISESDRWLVGMQVDRDGVTVGNAAADQLMHYIDTETIVKRTRLAASRKYGTLVTYVDSDLCD